MQYDNKIEGFGQNNIEKETDLSAIVNQINSVNQSIKEEYKIEPKIIADCLDKKTPASEKEKKLLDDFLAQVIKKDISDSLIRTNGQTKYDILIKKAFIKTADLSGDINPLAEKQFFADLNHLYTTENNRITPELTEKFQEGLGRIYNIKFEKVNIPDYLDDVEFQPDLAEILNELPPVMKCPIYNDHLGEYHHVRQSFARYLELKLPGVLDENGDNMIRSNLEKVILKAGTLQKIPFLIETLKMYGDYGLAQLSDEQKQTIKEITGSQEYQDFNTLLPGYQNLTIEQRIELGKDALNFAQKIIDGFAVNIYELKSGKVRV